MGEVTMKFSILRSSVAFAIVAGTFAQASPTDAIHPYHRVAGIVQPVLLGKPLRDEFVRKALFTPAEFQPASELQLSYPAFKYFKKALIGTVEKTAIIRVLVDSARTGQAMLQEYQSLGGDASRLKPEVTRFDSLWYQDYGPIYAYDAQGILFSNDFVYNRYGRKNDDAVPASVAKADGMRNNPVSMFYEGGNFISDGQGTCIASTRIFQQNPQMTQQEITTLMFANLGCQRFITLTPLVEDITYHIDLFAKLVAPKTILLGDFYDHPRNKQIMDENAKKLSQMGYEVVRLPVKTRGSQNYLSHINTFLINGYALMPTYGIQEDAVSAKVYQNAGFKVIGIPSQSLEGTGGAIHCILRSKPGLRR